MKLISFYKLNELNNRQFFFVLWKNWTCISIQFINFCFMTLLLFIIVYYKKCVCAVFYMFEYNFNVFFYFCFYDKKRLIFNESPIYLYDCWLPCSLFIVYLFNFFKYMFGVTLCNKIFTSVEKLLSLKCNKIIFF